MAWNRPKNGEAVSRPLQKRSGDRFSTKCTIIGVIVVALGAAAVAWWLWTGDESAGETPPPSSARQIKEVKPAAAPTNAVVVTKPKTPYWELESTNGFTEAMQRKWMNVRRPRKEPIKPHVNKGKYAIFNFRSENLIASVLAAKPGASMIGRPNYRGINEDFLKSCSVPIVVNADDDEYTRNLKNAMTATKIELKERIDAGEDLGKIIEDSREELRHLAQTKRMIEQEVRTYLKSDASPEDLDLYIQSANKLLEKKGLAPLRLGPIAKYKLMKLNKEN